MSVSGSPLRSIAQPDALYVASVTLLLLPMASGILLALSFSPGPWSILAWVALVPLGLALREGRNWPEFYFGMYVGGLIFQLAHLDWIRSGSGATWLSDPRATQWLAQGTLLAAIWPLVLWFGARFVRQAKLPMAAALPIVWVAFEFARKHLWALVDSTGYPYGQLGLTQAAWPPLIQIADLGGVYAVSAVVAMVNGLIVDVLCWLVARPRLSARSLIVPLLIVAVALGGTWLYGTWRLSQQVARAGPIVCLMPTGALEAIDAETAAPGSDMLPADLLIWCEGAYSRPVSIPPQETGSDKKSPEIEDMEQYARRANASLVIGCDRVAQDKRMWNSTVVVDRRRGYVGSYDKLRLVPFSEFNPPGRPSFRDSTTDRYVHGTDYPVFTVQTVRPVRESHFAVSICYDTCFSELYRRYLRPPKGLMTPQFFVVPACEDHDRGMRLQDILLKVAQFRAIECRRAFVRNAEDGYSGIIDGNGVLIAEPPEIDFQAPAVLGRMPLDERVSVYSLFGDWLPIAAWGAILLQLLWSKAVARQKGSSKAD
ncbi:MAG: apolipoprotein N-acyltransferase [Pirellulales bacterium]